MMKSFCDKCQQEITDKKRISQCWNQSELSGSSGGYKVFEGVYFNYTVRHPVDICKYCFIDLLSVRLDDRPRPA